MNSSIQKNLVEEMRELRRLRTAVMMEKCMVKTESVLCPKPQRQNTRNYGEQNDLKVGSELSDFLMNKASPPFYAGSPPIRANNPLIRDARFHEQSVEQNPSFGVNIVKTPRIRSVTLSG